LTSKGFGVNEKKETKRRMITHRDILQQGFKLIVELSNGLIVVFHEVIQHRQ
jgi:hypothetical protein